VFRPFLLGRLRRRDLHEALLDNPISSLEDHQQFLLHEAEALARIGKNDYHYQVDCTKSAFDVPPSVRLVKLFWSMLKKARKPIFHSDGTYNTRSEAYEVTVKIFDAFEQNALDRGALSIIIVFPAREDLWRSRRQRNVATIHSSRTSKREDIDSSTDWIRYRQMSIGIRSTS
jgi:hypothetical protein